MATLKAPDPLTTFLLCEQRRVVEALQQFADGRGAPALREARRILTAIAAAEAEVLIPALSRLSLRPEAEHLLHTMRDERAQQLEALEVLAHKRAPRLRKLGAVALGDLIHRHAQQHSALLIPVLASQLPRPLHRSIAQAFTTRYEAALHPVPRGAEAQRHSATASST